MTTLAAMLVALALGDEPAPAKFTFVDAVGPEMSATPRYRQLSLGDKPARPLGGAPEAGKGVWFSLARVGSSPESALGVVWQPDAPAIWLDADGDGKLVAAERHPFTNKTIDLPATIRVGTAALSRTLIFKRGSGTTLYGAVRGYTRGKLRLGDKDYDAALTDGDADGCFDSPGSDRIWIDLNGDGQFDLAGEQFPLGSPIKVEGRLFLIQPDPTGTVVRVRERGSETGRLQANIPLMPGAALQQLEASLVSEFGEMTVVNSTEPVSLPVGKYRVESLTIVASDAKQRSWTFHFQGQRQYAWTIESGKDAPVDLLDGLALTTGVQDGSARPGAQVTVAPMWQTSAGVYLASCEINGSFSGAGIALIDSGDNPLDRATSGFM
jgi:hypothetical protein